MARRRNELDQINGPVLLAARISEEHMTRIADQISGPHREQRTELIAGMDARQIIDEVVEESLNA
jgi:hypothetical protein